MVTVDGKSEIFNLSYMQIMKNTFMPQHVH